MAACVLCEHCGKVVDYKKAMHIRTYRLMSATTHNGGTCTDVADVCSDCYKELKHFITKQKETQHDK